VQVIKAHAEAVYKVVIAPDGQRMVSCSEDFSVRTWSFPEGYLLFVYEYHKSPVTTVSFSPTGR
jgi:WD40 repeat protein